MQSLSYDFFIAHAGKDVEKADQLYSRLSVNHLVFFDRQTLQAGENWTVVLPQALKNSRVIVLLLSKNASGAYFLQEEIARAIQLQRSSPEFYRLVPVYLDGFPANLEEIPYGLYQVQSLDLVKEMSLENIYAKLVHYLEAVPDKATDSYAIKERLSFRHSLHDFPVGPMVDGLLIPRILIESFANYVPVPESYQVIDEANAFRKQADPEENGAIIIQKFRLPFPASTAPLEFWMRAFTEARLNGPRMLAALVLSVRDTFFPKEAIDAKIKLLADIKQDH